MASGRVDTNVFVHALKDDPQSAECRAFVLLLKEGTIRARLEPYVVHELAYILPRRLPDWNREQIAAFLLNLLDWPGIESDRQVLESALVQWGQSPKLSFVDAILVAESSRDGSPIYTKNVKDFENRGVEVPDPLSGTESTDPVR